MLALAVGVLTPALLGAQRAAARASEAATARFVADARAGTARYRDQEVAIADGFRRVGVDFPGMGEHWVSLERIMADSFVAARPSVLTYASVRGVPTLVGVAYTAILEPGERLPEFAPGRAFWHEHNGSVDEESFPLGHHASALASRRGDGDPPLRLAVLHAWIWDRNPAGLFVADNWGLPLTRLGVEARPTVALGVLGALALALGAEEFYEQAINSGAALSPGEADGVERVVGRYRREVERTLADARARRRLTADDEHRLEALWTAMWADVERAAPTHAAHIREIAASPARSHSPADTR